jgi:hypothetical protein
VSLVTPSAFSYKNKQRKQYVDASDRTKHDRNRELGGMLIDFGYQYAKYLNYTEPRDLTSFINDGLEWALSSINKSTPAASNGRSGGKRSREVENEEGCSGGIESAQNSLFQMDCNTFSSISHCPSFLSHSSKLKAQYTTFTKRQKRAILGMYDSTVSEYKSLSNINVGTALTVKQTSKCKTFLSTFCEEKFRLTLSRKTINYWLKTRTKVYKQRGVKSNAEFESDVWSLVLVTQYVEVTKDTALNTHNNTT